MYILQHITCELGHLKKTFHKGHIFNYTNCPPEGDITFQLHIEEKAVSRISEGQEDKSELKIEEHGAVGKHFRLFILLHSILLIYWIRVFTLNKNLYFFEKSSIHHLLVFPADCDVFSSLISSDLTRMTDSERDQIDQDAQIFMRTCSEAIRQLRHEGARRALPVPFWL